MQYHRKSPRLSAFDYSQNGAYFITICAKDRTKLFGAVVGGGVLDAPYVQLSEYGHVVEQCIQEINATYSHISIEKHVIMPNHIHLLVLLHDTLQDSGDKGTPRTLSPTSAVIPSLVSTLKRFSNARCGFSMFQRSYHDHIIRGEADYKKIWEYIDTNPLRWTMDCFYIP
jgi:REP element-mobilizing transposase RayT